VNAAGRWFVVVVVSTLAALVATLIGSGNAVSTIPLLWFLAVCPGMPYARAIAAGGAPDPVQRWITAIALSLALGAVVSEVLLLVGWFTSFRTVLLLGVIACTGAGVDRARAHRRAAEALTAAGD
jgi:hypothetical protein